MSASVLLPSMPYVIPLLTSASVRIHANILEGDLDYFNDEYGHDDKEWGHEEFDIDKHGDEDGEEEGGEDDEERKNEDEEGNEDDDDGEEEEHHLERPITNSAPVPPIHPAPDFRPLPDPQQKPKREVDPVADPQTWCHILGWQQAPRTPPAPGTANCFLVIL